MPRKKAAPKGAVYNVHSRLSGAQVIIGVPLDDARAECARLNAEARVVNPSTGFAVGLHCGVVTTYEVVGTDGLVQA